MDDKSIRFQIVFILSPCNVRLMFTNDYTLFCKNWGLQTTIFFACTKSIHLHIVSAKVFTSLDPRFQSTKPYVSVTNTLKHAQAPPVCQTHFPSDPSRGEARVEVADTLLMPSAHFCVSVCVCACLLMPSTWLTAHMCTRQISFHYLGNGKVAQCAFANFRRIHSYGILMEDGTGFKSLRALQQHLQQSAPMLQTGTALATEHSNVSMS